MTSTKEEIEVKAYREQQEKLAGPQDSRDRANEWESIELAWDAGYREGRKTTAAGIPVLDTQRAWYLLNSMAEDHEDLATDPDNIDAGECREIIRELGKYIQEWLCTGPDQEV